MDDNVMDFAAYKAKAAEAKATPALDATVATAPNDERNTQAFAEHARVIRRLVDRLMFDGLDKGWWKSTGKGKPRSPSRIAADIVDIGRRWTECRRIARRNWSPWLKQIGWSDQDAQSYINIYEWHLRCVIDATSSDSDRVFDFDLEDSLDFHLLVDPSTPEAARAAVVRRAGEKLEHADVMAIIRRAMTNERKRKSRGS
jgi:hypothetical protein